MDATIKKCAPLWGRPWADYFSQVGAVNSVANGAETRWQTFADFNVNMMRSRADIPEAPGDKTEYLEKTKGTNALVLSRGMSLGPRNENASKNLNGLLEADNTAVHDENALLRKHVALLELKIASKDTQVESLKRKVEGLQKQLTVLQARNVFAEYLPWTSTGPPLTPQLSKPNADVGLFDGTSTPPDTRIRKTYQPTPPTPLPAGGGRYIPATRAMTMKSFSVRGESRTLDQSFSQPKMTPVADTLLSPLCPMHGKDAGRNKIIRTPSQAVPRAAVRLRSIQSTADISGETVFFGKARALSRPAHPLGDFWTCNMSPTRNKNVSSMIPDLSALSTPQSYHSLHSISAPRAPLADEESYAPAAISECATSTNGEAHSLPQGEREQRLSTHATPNTDAVEKSLQPSTILLDGPSAIANVSGDHRICMDAVHRNPSLGANSKANGSVPRHTQSTSVGAGWEGCSSSKGHCHSPASTVKKEEGTSEELLNMLVSPIKAEEVTVAVENTKFETTPFLRHAKGKKGSAGVRDSHVTACVSCQDSPLRYTPIAFCEECPRSFCAICLVNALRKQGVVLERVSYDTRAFLVGERGKFYIRECPSCVRRCDSEFTLPPKGIAPMNHLLKELLKHDLSHWFRKPVNTMAHPNYLESVGRGYIMDLGTMMTKIDACKYPRRRGPGQFMGDLSRVWRNTRRYAGCDELGQPCHGSTVPGIVRCALILEAMSEKFCAVHISDDRGTVLPETSWDQWRQRKKQEMAKARLKQLERRKGGWEKNKTTDYSKNDFLGSSASSSREAYTCTGPVGHLCKIELSVPTIDCFPRKRLRPVLEGASEKDGGVGKRQHAQQLGMADTHRQGSKVSSKVARYSASMDQKSKLALFDDFCEIAAEFSRSKGSVPHG